MAAVAEKETLGFQTEVKQLLHLMINSLYSNKEIFLRELVSNAADAADKLRFKALSNSGIYGDDTELKVQIDFDKKKRTVTLSDNGIGMTRDEVIANLGTIAKSGTKEFLSSLTGDQAKDTQLIGQFGVGFYSSFIVADKVTVTTRHAEAKEEEAVRWISAGEGDYSIETVKKASRGTEIILHLRKGEDEFLDDFRLRNIIQKYAEHIALPVHMKKQEVETEEEKEKKKDEKIIDVPVYEAVNKAQALWMTPKSELKDEEYNDFYKHISHDFEDPLTWSHNKVEGKLEYTSLLYVPGRAPFDMWNRERQYGLKLYVQRVFIMDEAEQFMPAYLRFMKGVIDSNDLPLNVSREILQGNKVVDTIRTALVKRTLDMLSKLAKKDADKYQKFWNEFGSVIKEGPGEDFANREKIAKLLRFSTTHNTDDKQNVSLDDYISRMQKDQDAIYYITADTWTAAKNSPHLESLRDKGVEVVLLYDRVDEWLVSHLNEYEGKKFQSVAKGNLDLGKLSKDEEKEQKDLESKFEDFVKRVKESLKDQVKDVRLTHRLKDSPACLVADDHDMGRQLQRMMEAAGQKVPTSQPIFEVNPKHAFVVRMQAETDESKFTTWSQILFDQAVLSEGGKLEDPATYVQRLNGLLLDLTK